MKHVQKCCEDDPDDVERANRVVNSCLRTDATETASARKARRRRENTVRKSSWRRRQRGDVKFLTAKAEATWARIYGREPRAQRTAVEQGYPW